MNSQFSPAAKVRLALVLTALVICAGTVGFMVLENTTMLDALYMTVITLSTVGFREVMPLHATGKVFVIVLILFGVALAGFTASAIGQWVVEGQFKQIFGRRRMENKIKQMKDHFILAGYGRVGRQVAAEFAQRKAPFVVIEKGEEALERLLDDGHLHLAGTATDDNVLHKAQIHAARTLISTLPDEAQNVYLTLTARDMNKTLNIIARADYEGGEKKLMRAGANHVVSPHVLGGQRMAMASMRPNVVDFMHTTSLGADGPSIEEIALPEGSWLDQKSLLESNLKRDYSVHLIGIKRHEEKMQIAPGPETVLRSGDVLLLIGSRVDLERLTRELN